MKADAKFTALLRLADDHLVLGHRLSEWCGHAPMLEEDLAMPNIALDLLGQARALFSYAGEVEDKGNDEDQLAYLRLERDYTNLLMLERPNGDFGHTMLRQFYFSTFMELFWEKACNSKDSRLAEIAAKAVKESRYHFRHTAEWVIRLGDGTEESHARMVQAVDDLAPYVGEFFVVDDIAETAISDGIIPDLAALKSEWETRVSTVFAEATLQTSFDAYAQLGGRSGEHTEAMGFLLAELQFMQRTYPNMTW